MINWTVKEFVELLKRKGNGGFYINLVVKGTYSSWEIVNKPIPIEHLNADDWALWEEYKASWSKRPRHFFEILLRNIHYKKSGIDTSISSIFVAAELHKLDFLPMYRSELLFSKMNNVKKLADFIISVIQDWNEFHGWYSLLADPIISKYSDIFSTVVYPLLRPLNLNHPIFSLSPKELVSKLLRYLRVVMPFIKNEAQLVKVFELTFTDFALSKLRTNTLKDLVKLTAIA